jgi:hypothetical protein
MHEPLLARAALPAPTIVLGLTLRPYSIGHELYLQREVSNQPGKAEEGLIRAALICCQTWNECRAMGSDFFILLKLAIWRRRRKIRASKFDFEKELATFARYRLEGSLAFPPSDVLRPDRGAPPRLPGSPFLLRLQQFLMLEFHLSEARAWDYPLGLAQMRYAAFYEEKGGCDIYNQQNADFDAFIAEQERKGAEQCQA